MKPARITLLATIFAFLAAVIPGWAEDFTGRFTGDYLTGWTTVDNNNPQVTVLSAALIDAVGLTMTGAKSRSPDQTDPPSSIDITHLVVGTGPTQVSFSSIYFGANLVKVPEGGSLRPHAPVANFHPNDERAAIVCCRAALRPLPFP